MSPSLPPDDSRNVNAVETVVCEIDARGLACPLPLLKAKLGLNRLGVGECLRVLATDAGSVRDFHAFAEISGHRLLHFRQSNGEYEYVLQKIEKPGLK